LFVYFCGTSRGNLYDSTAFFFVQVVVYPILLPGSIDGGIGNTFTLLTDSVSVSIEYCQVCCIVAVSAVVTTRQESAGISSMANVMKTTRRAAATHQIVQRVLAVTFRTVVATTMCQRTAAKANSTSSARAIHIGRRTTAITRAATSTGTTPTTTATTWTSTAPDTPTTGSATAG